MKRSGPPKRRKPLERQAMVVPRPRPLHARRRQRPLRAQRATQGVDYKAEATRLHSLLVRHGAGGRCEKCGGSHPLECAHIVPRRHAATRTDEMNGLGLCGSCHTLIDTDPDEKRRLAVAIIGEWDYRLLLDKARRGVKADEVFWRGEYDRLLPPARALGLA